MNNRLAFPAAVPAARRALFLAWMLALALGLSLSVPPPAAAQSAADLSAADRAELARMESYLNGIGTLRARFTQISETEGFATGTFYLSRPGRMRIEYDPPVPYLYVADGTWLTFWDGELEQRSDVLLGSTVVDIFVRQDVRFSGSLTVTSMHHGGDEIFVDLVQSSDPHAGMMTLIFQDEPLALSRWVMVDGQGLTTEVSLHDIERGVSLSSGLFTAPRPDLRTGQ